MHKVMDLLHNSSSSIIDCSVHPGVPPGFPLHTHPVWEITIQCHGIIQTRQGKETYDTYPGTIILHPPNTPHGDISSSNYELLFIRFSIPPRAWTPILIDDVDHSIEQTCRMILREWRNHLLNRDELVNVLADQLILLIERAANIRRLTESEQLISDAVRIIEERYIQSFTFYDLCKELSVSRSKLRREFVKSRGQTPQDYLLAVRLRKAITSLQNTDLKLETIAEISGYNSASHLSRHVKSATGLSPGQIRKHCLSFE